LPLFRSFEAPGATGAVSLGEGARFQAFEVPLVTVRQVELLKEVVLSCPKLGASAVRRRFWAVALVLGLLFLGQTVFAHSTLKLKSFGC
jgi:hypothetical protein